MANLFRDGGYSVERFHSGMLAYLCQLYNEGTSEPLASFMEHLGLNLAGGRLRPALEWKQIDLVIHEVSDHNPSEENPLVAFKMKVDSVEGKVKGEWQTLHYPRLLPKGTPFRYVTLGAGEIHRAPRGHGCDVHAQVFGFAFPWHGLLGVEGGGFHQVADLYGLPITSSVRVSTSQSRLQTAAGQQLWSAL